MLEWLMMMMMMMCVYLDAQTGFVSFFPFVTECRRTSISWLLKVLRVPPQSAS